MAEVLTLLLAKVWPPTMKHCFDDSNETPNFNNRKILLSFVLQCHIFCMGKTVWTIAVDC